tara:strand:- start:1601 stop:3325 length:1725 start_codon:yes stop_codon:yes gene_type:complete
MSIKIQRIQSREAGPFKKSGGRTRCHIDVPSSVGFSDLENSRMVFRMKANVRSPNGDTALLPAFIAQPKMTAAGGANQTINQPIDVQGAQALIKNSRCISDEYGELNSQRDQNVVSANLDSYTDYSSCLSAKNSFNAGGSLNLDPNETSQLPVGMFLRPARPRAMDDAGSVASGTNANGIQQNSRAITAEVRCPLKHVDRLADGTRQFPNISAGNITYRIEFEDVRPVMSLGAPFSANCIDSPINAANLGSAARPILYQYDKTNVNSGEIRLSNLESLPFYVGMPIRVSGTNIPTGATSYVTINKITINEADSGSVLLGGAHVARIEVADSVGFALTNAANAATVVVALNQGNGDGTNPTELATVDYEIEDVFLELHTIQLMPQQIAAAQKALQSLQIPYMEHRLVKKVLNSTQDYAETLYLDAGCAGVAVITPPNNGLVSGYDNGSSYRFSFDGRNVTNREIAIGPAKTDSGISTAASGVGRQLHNHMLQKFYGNIGQRLMRFEKPADNYNRGIGDLQLNNHALYPLVTPMVPNDVIAQFQVRSAAGLMATKEMFYVSMYPRSLNFEKGRLVM